MWCLLTFSDHIQTEKLLKGVWAEQEENLQLLKIAQKSVSFHKRWQIIVLVTPFRHHSRVRGKEGWRQEDRARARERAEGGVTSSIPLRTGGYASSSKSHQCYTFCIPSGSDTRNHRSHRCPEHIYSGSEPTQRLKQTFTQKWKVCHHLQIDISWNTVSSFMFCRRKEVTQVWNNTPQEIIFVHSLVFNDNFFF